MQRTLVILALLISANTALAQGHQPYTGMEQREVKALSPQQIADLKAGRGMGLALPAELNGYPGPMHVLEHADALQLTSEQRKRTAALIGAMKAEAIPAGEHLIAQETNLDGLFARREITLTALREATAAIGSAQARLRETHLKYHLAMMDVLTPEQVARYNDLRGYGSQPRIHKGHP